MKGSEASRQAITGEISIFNWDVTQLSLSSRSAHGVIIVYDLTKRQTFLSLQKWINEIRNYTSSSVICGLVGNKCDLPEEREVTSEEADEVCHLIPEILFQIETSAKENTNVENAFRKIAEELMVSTATFWIFHKHYLTLFLFKLEPPKQRRRRTIRWNQAG